MKKFGIVALLMVMVLCMGLILTACGGGRGPSNLEEIVANDEELKAEIQAIADSNGLEIEVKGNTMTFTYRYGEEFNDAAKAQAAPLIETALKEYETTFQGLAKDLEDSTKISGIVIKVNYVDAAESELYSAEYTAE